MLVAKWFHQTPEIDFQDTYSPIIKASTIRVIFTLVIWFTWSSHFIPLHSTSSQFSHHVCKLNKALYGLKQAPRAWIFKLRIALVGQGFLSSQVDVSLFIKRVGSKVLFLLVYVDDILITGNDHALLHHTITSLNATFALKYLGVVSYFFGFKVSRDSKGILST